MRFFRKKQDIKGAQDLDRWLDSGRAEDLLARARSNSYQIVTARTVTHGSYDPGLMRRVIDVMKAKAAQFERRGRDTSSFRELIAQAEEYLAAGPQVSGEAHRYGYAAMLSLNDARVGIPGGSALYTLHPARKYATAPEWCELCEAFEAELKFCHDFLCIDCFASEVMLMLQAEAYWTAPNDEAYAEFDPEEARQRANQDADRILSEQ
jgi:hypothetical protein